MPKNRMSLSGMLFCVFLAVSQVGCGGGRPQPVISVSLSSAKAIVQVGATMGFSAIAGGDPNNAGVNWTLSCSAASCGGVSPSSTPSGMPTAYSAPPTPPASNLNVTLTATSVSDPTKSAFATITVPSVGVTVTPSTVTVASGGKQQFTATVIGDSSNGGVTWSMVKSYFCLLKCSPVGTNTSPCDSSCGTVSPASTGSATPVTYTAPATPPSFRAGSTNDQLLLIATSVTNTIAGTTASITVIPISVAVSPTSTSVALNAAQQFTATVTNDGTNSGVTWSLSQTGAACSPGCGIIAPASTASGAAATYTPPATAPALPLVTVTATSVEDTTKSSASKVTLTTATGSLACGAGSGSESLLKGQYAFRLQGFNSNGVVVIAGSFAADGTGKVTGGEEDSNGPSAQQVDASFNATGSSYAVGPDHRGCLTLAITNGGTTYFRFALGSINTSNIATAGHMIEFDDTAGAGSRVAGTLRLQDSTSFLASQFKGNYAVGMDGQDGSGGRFAIAGTLASSGISAITSSAFDIDDAGTITSNIASAPGGSFTCCSSNGRGTLQLTAGSFTSSLAFYMISSSHVFLVNSGAGQYAGEAIGVPTGTMFNQASLNGSAIFRKTAQPSTGPIVDVALASSNGTGSINIVDNTNNAGTFSSGTTPFTYTVASNGRVTLMGGTKPPVLYLYGPNAGFLVGTDTNVEFGVIESQTAGLTNASLSGAYTFGTENSSASTVITESGVVTADGNGNAAGTSDQSSPTGLAQNQALNFTYSFPANGMGNVGTNTTAILISGNKLVFINNTTTNPTITVVEK